VIREIKMFIGETLWNASEAKLIPPLGRLAPVMFGWMIGCRGKKMKKK
jgi:hypothetical protein